MTQALSSNTEQIVFCSYAAPRSFLLLVSRGTSMVMMNYTKHLQLRVFVQAYHQQSNHHNIITHTRPSPIGLPSSSSYNQNRSSKASLPRSTWASSVSYILVTGRPSRHPAAVARAAVGASQMAVPQNGSSSTTPDILSYHSSLPLRRVKLTVDSKRTTSDDSQDDEEVEE